MRRLVLFFEFSLYEQKERLEEKKIPANEKEKNFIRVEGFNTSPFRVRLLICCYIYKELLQYFELINNYV
jgi:hypothetical protein